MQIKARMKYHLTPTRMATIKKEKQGEFSGGLVVRIPHFHCYSLGSIPGGRKKKPNQKPEDELRRAVERQKGRRPELRE